MARIDFEAVAHSYIAQPAGTAGLRAQAAAVRVRGRRRLCAARARPAAARPRCSTSSRACCSRARAGSCSTARDVTRLAPAQRNIAQVFQFPVIYDTMTVGENLAFPLRNRGVAPAADGQARIAEVAAMLDLEPLMKRRAAGLTRRPEAEDLARPRPGARGRGGDPVRRAADGDRPAPQMAAAAQAQGGAQPVPPHPGLRHPRPERGADLRREGRGDVRGRGRAARHAAGTVRAARRIASSATSSARRA